MRLKFSDLEKECTVLEYSDENNIFLIKDSSENVMCQYCPVLDLDNTYNPSNFVYKILYNERDDYSENSIFEVYVKNQRIGWIFPFQALISDLHDYSENKFFLRYAFVTVYLLLNNIKSYNEKEFSFEILLQDFYNENVSLLVIDCDNISKIEKFNIDDYTVSLYKNGYSYNGRGNVQSEIDIIDKRLNLKSISNELKSISYLDNLFKNEIPKERESFARFHTYYQIIEILISIVFKDKFRKYVNDLKIDSDDLLQKKEKLGDLTLEKRRVVWLFYEYVNISSNLLLDLNESCEKILIKNHIHTGKNAPENLYLVRCLIVHSMYKLDEESYNLLEIIDTVFLDVLIEMLLSFQIK